MIIGLLQKEWIKTRWVLLALCLLALGTTTYDLLSLQRVINLRGVTHLWEILLTKDVLFMSAIKYQPLLTGVVIAIAQFVPEMSQKRLKLTLHLPISQTRTTITLLTFGAAMMLLFFALQHVLLYLYISAHLAPELVGHILLSTTPWFLAGIASYGITALIVLEPTWLRRVMYILTGYGITQLFFVITTPRAYQEALLPLLLFVVLLCYSSFLSISRFKKGVQ